MGKNTIKTLHKKVLNKNNNLKRKAAFINLLITREWFPHRTLNISTVCVCVGVYVYM